jgi:hypothetical protein
MAARPAGACTAGSMGRQAGVLSALDGSAAPGPRRTIMQELATNGHAPAGSDTAARLDGAYAEVKQQQAAANVLSDPEFLRLGPTEAEAREFAGAFSMVSGVGEAVDVWTLFSPSANGFERGMAAASLTLNVFTLGFAPNCGGVAGKADDVAEVFRGAARGTARGRTGGRGPSPE